MCRDPKTSNSGKCYCIRLKWQRKDIVLPESRARGNLWRKNHQVGVEVMETPSFPKKHGPKVERGEEERIFQNLILRCPVGATHWLNSTRTWPAWKPEDLVLRGGPLGAHGRTEKCREWMKSILKHSVFSTHDPKYYHFNMWAIQKLLWCFAFFLVQNIWKSSNLAYILYSQCILLQTSHIWGSIAICG